jgi:hypothetical protein
MKTKKGIARFGKWVLIFALIAFILSMPALFPHSRKVGLFLQAIGVIASAIIALFAIWGERIRAATSDRSSSLPFSSPRAK